jgi:hypothetical protein
MPEVRGKIKNHRELESFEHTDFSVWRHADESSNISRCHSSKTITYGGNTLSKHKLEYLWLD